MTSNDILNNVAEDIKHLFVSLVVSCRSSYYGKCYSIVFERGFQLQTPYNTKHAQLKLTKMQLKQMDYIVQDEEEAFYIHKNTHIHQWQNARHWTGHLRATKVPITLTFVLFGKISGQLLNGLPTCHDIWQISPAVCTSYTNITFLDTYKEEPMLNWRTSWLQSPSLRPLHNVIGKLLMHISLFGTLSIFW